MAGSNLSLQSAKNDKNNEFYTQLSDIEKELKHYRAHFRDATIFCNCDDPGWSNFWKYFHLNFEFLGLKKLITTHYDHSEPTYKIEYEGGDDADVTLGDVTPLQMNGDFRSPECIELLKEADIVVTNPPFSLFREYVAQLIEHHKRFVIIGSMNALHYKEIFPLIQHNLVWLGFNSVKEFKQPDGSIKKFGNVLWFTNLDITKRHETLDLIKKYNASEYPKYDNFDAIDVSKVTDIPTDYDGVMGVPDGFLEYYNPDQFELIGVGSGEMAKAMGVTKNYRGRTDIAYTINGVSKCPYSRILIKRKKS